MFYLNLLCLFEPGGIIIQKVLCTARNILQLRKRFTSVYFVRVAALNSGVDSAV